MHDNLYSNCAARPRGRDANGAKSMYLRDKVAQAVIQDVPEVPVSIMPADKPTNLKLSSRRDCCSKQRANVSGRRSTLASRRDVSNSSARIHARDKTSPTVYLIAAARAQPRKKLLPLSIAYSDVLLVLPLPLAERKKQIPRDPSLK